MEKRLLDINKIIKSKKHTRDSLMQFWNIFPKKFDSTIEISYVKKLYRSIFCIFWKNISEEAVSNYVNDQIEIRSLINNQSLKQNSIEQNFGDETNKQKNYILNERDIQNFEKVPDKAQSINIDYFIDILIDFYLMIAINPMVETAAEFFNFIYARIMSDQADISQCDVQITKLKKTDSYFNFVYLLIKNQSDNEFDQDKDNGISKGSILYENIKPLMQDAQNYLAAQLNSNDTDKTIKKFIDNEEPFFTFFAIECGKVKLLLNIGIYAKFLFEKLQLKESNDWVLRDLIDKEIYSDINYVKRYEELYKKGKDPYFMNKINKYKFEADILNIKKRLYDGNYCFDLTELSDIIEKYQKNYEVNEITEKPESYIDKRIEDEYLPVSEDILLHNNHHFDRLLRIAELKELTILLVGKPYTKKTYIGKKMAHLLDIEFINTDVVMEDFIAEYNEEDEISEEKNYNDDGEEIEPLIVYSENYQQMKQLKEGGVLSKEFIIAKVVKKLREIKKTGKSYILEISSDIFDYKDIDNIVNFEYKDTPTFNYIVELKLTDDEVINRGSQMNEYLITNEQDELTSLRFDQYELKEIELKTKRAEFLNGEEEEEKEKKVQLLPDELKEEVIDYKSPIIEEQLKESYKIVLNKEIESIIFNYKKQVNQFVNDYIYYESAECIQLDVTALTPFDIISILIDKFRKSKQIYPRIIEGASNYSELLKFDKNEEEFDIINVWSFYKDIDCVDYVETKRIVRGVPENAVEYYGFVFIFSNEDNRNKFVANPKKYIKSIPILKNEINISILSHTFKDLNNLIEKVIAFYDFKVVDPVVFGPSFFNKIEQQNALVNDKNDKEGNTEQKETIQMYFDKLGINILSYKEKLYTGEGLNIKEILRMHFFEIGGHMEFKMDEETELERLKELADKNSKKKKSSKKKVKIMTLLDLVPAEYNIELKIEYYERLLDEELDFDKTIIEEELNLLKVKQSKLDYKGYMFINMPYTASDIEEFKIFGFDMDKIIYMFNNEIVEDLNFVNEIHNEINIEEEIAIQTELLSSLEEVYGDEKLVRLPYKSTKDINYYGLKIRDIIDPFKEKLDTEVTYREADYEETDNREKVTRHLFGEYCPVNLVNFGWFSKGDYNLNVQINNEVVFFVNENNKIEFEDKYEDYISFMHDNDPFELVENNKRIFLQGALGSGVKTLTNYLRERYQLSIVNIKNILMKQKEDYIKNYVEEKNLRKSFEPESDDADAEPIDIVDIYDPDPDENEAVEKQLIEKVFMNHNNCVFVFDMFLDERQSKIFKSNIMDIIKEKGLLPDHLIWLRNSEKIALTRIINEDNLKELHKTQLEDYERRKQQVLNEKRIEIFDGMEDEEKEEINGPEDIEIDDKDIDIEEPLNYEDLLEKEKEKIIELRQLQLSVTEETANIFDDLKIPVKQISTETSLDKVKVRLSSAVDEIIIGRKSNFELGKLMFISDSEQEDLSVEHKIKKMILSESYNISKYGFYNYLKPYESIKTLDYNFVYKNQIYFVSRKEELDQIKNNPKLLGRKEIFDEKFNNCLIYFLNFVDCPHLKALIEDEFQTNIINLSSIYNTILKDEIWNNYQEYEMNNFKWFFSNINYTDYVKINTIQAINPFDLKITEIRECLNTKGKLTDEQKIDLILIWLRTFNYQNKPIIIENFPENDIQRRMMHEKGLIPDFVIDYTGSRFNPDDSKSCETDLHRELNQNDLKYFYSHNYENLYTLNISKKVEANIEMIRRISSSYKNNLKALINAKSEGKFYNLNHINCSSEYLKDKLSSNIFLDLSLYNATNKHAILPPYRKYMYCFNDSIYLMSNPETIQTLLHNDYKIESSNLANIPQLNIPLIYCKISNDVPSIVEYQANCPISLAKNKFDDGYDFYSFNYKGKTYNFKDYNSFKQFFEVPSIYAYQRFDPQRLNSHLEIKYKRPTEKELLIDEVTFALNQVCRSKPKHFKISIKETVLKLFALYIKSRNPYKNEIYKDKFSKALEDFLQDCLASDKLKNDCTNVDYWAKLQKEVFLRESDQILDKVREISLDKAKYFNRYIN